jgi:hypothetical protein
LRIREETRRKRCACDVCYIKVNCDDNIFNFPRNSVLFCSLTSLIHTLELVGSNSHFEFKFKCFKKKTKIKFGKKREAASLPLLLAPVCCLPAAAAAADHGSWRHLAAVADHGYWRHLAAAARWTAAHSGSSRLAASKPAARKPAASKSAACRLSQERQQAVKHPTSTRG